MEIRLERALRTAAQALPRPMRGALRSVYHRMFRAHLRLKAAAVGWRETFPLRECEPFLERSPYTLPPPMLRYRVAEDMSAGTFLQVGADSADNLIKLFEIARCPLSSCKQVLDFGCGCGRTLRWLAPIFPTVQFWGTDVDREAVEWNTRNILPGRFRTNGEWPPLPFDDREFDAIYAVSVFSHLDEEHQRAWARELSRVIRPGGATVLTLHGLSSAPRVGKTLSASDLQQGIVFCRTRKLESIHPHWYQTAFNSRQVTIDLFGEYFSQVRYEQAGFGYQDAIVCHL